MSPPTPPQPNAKRYWGEEKNIDSIYSIYLKKICYSYNNDISLSASTNFKSTATPTNPLIYNNHYHNKHQHKNKDKEKNNFSLTKQKHHKSMHELSSETNYQLYNSSQPKLTPPAQLLQWETRQIKVLQAATLDHALKFILLINSSSSSRILKKPKDTSSLDSNNLNSNDYDDDNDSNNEDSSILEEERNNVAHITHVMFCTYRIYTNPYELMLKLMDYSDLCRIEQYRFVMHYWMDNYPEDFDFIVEFPENNNNKSNNKSSIKSASSSKSITNSNNINNNQNNNNGATSITSYNYSINSYDSSTTTRTVATTSTTDSENNSATSSSNNNNNNQNLLLNSNSIQLNGHSNNNNNNRTKLTTTTTDKSNTLNAIESGASSTNSGGSNSIDDQLNRRLSNLSIGNKTNNNNNTSTDGITIKSSSLSSVTGVPLVNELLRLCRDDYIINKAKKLNELKYNSMLMDNNSNFYHDNFGSNSKTKSRRHNQRNNLFNSSSNSSSSSAILDFDSRYVAQQLTAIDLENFLNLKPYSLLEGTKSDKRIQSMIKNFNLLSRHVVVTILKSHQPHIVTSHWITIAMNLRKIKNFNSLKAIIAGLTNESIYRLKQCIWNKLDRTNLGNFRLMASIVDDVNNQTVLRQTQLIVEGTAKMSIEDDSFGTIPYLGTFLTDLNMIDARYQSYVPSPKDETLKLKLINFEKCAKQFEILTQVQLLQKNVLASLHAIQRRNHFDEQTTLNRLKLEFNQNHQMLLAKPAIPQVSRLFENWFYDNNVATMTDKQCFEISVKLEQNNVIAR